MVARESRPGGNRTARRLAEDFSTVRPTAVIDARVTTDWHEQRRILDEIATMAPRGARVRLRVGKSTPGPWIRDFLRGDLRYQLESRDIRALAEWNVALGGEEL